VLLLLLTTPGPPSVADFEFETSLEDLVVLSSLRALILSGSYGYASHWYIYR